MTISQAQIKKTAEKLSKVRADDTKIAEKIQNTLSYLDMLSEVDTTGVTPTYNVINNSLKLRKDEIIPSDVVPRNILDCSPQKVVSNQIVLPSIL